MCTCAHVKQNSTYSQGVFVFSNEADPLLVYEILD